MSSLEYDEDAAVELVKSIRELDHLCDVPLVAGLDKQRYCIFYFKIQVAFHQNGSDCIDNYYYYNGCFESIFQGVSHFMEVDQNEILLGGIDGDSLRTIIDFCYSCEIEINTDNVCDVMAAASRMELVRLHWKKTLFSTLSRPCGWNNFFR